MSSPNSLIDETTGEIDMLHVGQAAHIQAVREFGSPNYPPRTLRSATDFVLTRASAERRNWHRDRGLPVPGEEVLVTAFVPSWGASGDSFRR